MKFRDGSITIAAAMKDPKPRQMGIRYFDDSEWAQPGYELIRRICAHPFNCRMRRGAGYVCTECGHEEINS